MSSLTRKIIFGLGIILVIFLLWYFSGIVTYIVAAAVIALIGEPLVELMGRIRPGRYDIPRWFRSLLTLLIIWTLFIGFFRIFIPLIAHEANELSGIDAESVLVQLQKPLDWAENIYEEFNIGQNGEESFREYVKAKISSVLDFSIISNLFGSLAGILGDIFIAIFSISFIAFFLLKEQNLLTNAIVLLAPEKHEQNLRHAIRSIKYLLSRYFIGIGLQVTGILVLVTIGMNIIGLGFTKSLLIGLTAAILNVIPYLGPLIGTTLGIMLGIAFNINMEFPELVSLAGWMLVVFIVVQLIDNLLFQPLIFSSSVNAHPLEIFLVIMMAGSMAGVTGMIVAIPAYTILRVFAKEFFNQFRLVKKLTEKI